MNDLDEVKESGNTNVVTEENGAARTNESADSNMAIKMQDTMSENMTNDYGMDIDYVQNTKKAKKAYCSLGWKFALYGIVSTALQFLYVILVPILFGTNVVEKDWYQWMIMIIPLYVLAFPMLSLLVSKDEKTKIEKHSMSFGKFICCALMCAGIIGIGATVGLLANMLFTLPFGANSNDTNALAQLMENSNPFFRILTVGILAPIVEEFIFRKFLIDRVVKYGELLAILTSGIMFGLFHGNFNQVFYAAGLGMLFAFIYVRTGKIWYTIIFHMMVNLTTSVFTMFFLGQCDLEKLQSFASMDPNSAQAQETLMEILPGMLALMGWMGFLGICVLTGIVLLICFRKRFFTKIQSNPIQQKKGFSTVYLNWGMITFVLYCLVVFVMTYLSAILGN